MSKAQWCLTWPVMAEASQMARQTGSYQNVTGKTYKQIQMTEAEDTRMSTVRTSHRIRLNNSIHENNTTVGTQTI